MAHDAFAHNALGSSALMVIGALHARSGQAPAELIGSASLSRATVYRTLARLEAHHLVQRFGAGWSLTAQALRGIGNSVPEAVTAPAAESELAVAGWDVLAAAYGTAGVAAARRALHTAERTAYRAALQGSTSGAAPP
jgi:hypothetical protein